jgi:hypothetical protein
MFNPLSSVTDYQTMLNRIFWFVTGAALVAISILRSQVPAIDQGLRTIDLSLAIGGEQPLPVPAGSLLPAIAIGLVCRMIRPHARLSDWLGIRERFDIDVVLHELAARVGVDLSLVGEAQLEERRRTLMRQTFYRYVSGHPVAIDPQLVHQALDSWSWFWIAMESATLFVGASLLMVAFGAHDSGIRMLLATLVVAGTGLPTLRAKCRRLAIAQVRAILSDDRRREEVRAALAATLDADTPLRRAA